MHAMLRDVSDDPDALWGWTVKDLISSGAGAMRSSNKEGDVDPEAAFEGLREVARNSWAANTMKQRCNLWARLEQWAAINELAPNHNTAALFVIATSVSKQGMMAYANRLAATFTQIGMPNTSLRGLADALRRQGAAIPLRQALPLLKSELMAWAYRQEEEVLLCAAVAWKSASRWGEVAELPSKSFILVEKGRVIIDWWTIPKGRKGNPFRLSRWAVLQGDLVDLIVFLLRKRGPFDRLSMWTSDVINRAWRRDPSMARFTGHSVKRGAVAWMFREKSRGADVHASLISRLAKHKEEAAPDAPVEMTVRYGSADPVATAILLQTGKASALL